MANTDHRSYIVKKKSHFSVVLAGANRLKRFHFNHTSLYMHALPFSVYLLEYLSLNQNYQNSACHTQQGLKIQ